MLAGKPGDFVAHQLDALSTYESTFGIRQIDGNFVPPAGGVLGLNPPGTDASSGAGISGTTPPVLTAAGLVTFPALAGPVPFDTGTFGAPGTVQTSLPTGATETPLLNDAAGNVLIGVYQHPPTGDTQPNVDEMTLGFNYNLNMTQWLMLGPGLIDWVTGGAHLGLYRNYSTLHVDDMFTPDDTWNTTTHANDYDPGRRRCACARSTSTRRPTWSKTNNFRLDILFNGGNSTTNSVDGADARPAARRVPEDRPRDGQAVHPGLRLAQPHLGPRLPRRRLRHHQLHRGRSPAEHALGRVGAGRHEGHRRSRARLEHRQLARPRDPEPDHARARRPLRLRQPRCPDAADAVDPPNLDDEVVEPRPAGPSRPAATSTRSPTSSTAPTRPRPTSRRHR